MEDKAKMLTSILAVAGFFVSTEGHGVATSSQSMISGEGWRYGYGIAHGPPGIGHAVGESFPHGYGGFGTYAPSYGYNLVPPALPPHPVVVKLPPTYVLPAPVAPYPGHLAPYPGQLAPLPVEPILPPLKPLVFPKPIPIIKAPYAYRPYHNYRPYYYLDDHENYGHDHYHDHEHYHHEDPYYFHHKK